MTCFIFKLLTVVKVRVNFVEMGYTHSPRGTYFQTKSLLLAAWEFSEKYDAIIIMAETSVPESFQICCNKLCFFCFITFNPSLSLGSLLFHSCFFSTLERPLKFFHFFSQCSVLFYSKTTPSDANLKCCDVIFSGKYKSRKAESVVETPFSFCRALVKRIGIFIFHPFWKY